jgi:hypothetical protein
VKVGFCPSVLGRYLACVLRDLTFGGGGLTSASGLGRAQSWRRPASCPPLETARSRHPVSGGQVALRAKFNAGAREGCEQLSKLCLIWCFRIML